MSSGRPRYSHLAYADGSAIQNESEVNHDSSESPPISPMDETLDPRRSTMNISPRASFSPQPAIKPTRPGPTPHPRTISGSNSRSVLSEKWHKFSIPDSFSPWVHSFDEKNRQSTIAYYDRHQQRRRLFRNSTLQWLITAVFCAAIAACLKGYQRRGALGIYDKHVFNALTTGLSLAIASNLVSSLRSYANMLRWRLLATGWRSIEEFDLILSAESQFKVLRLLWIGGRSKPGFPFISRTQFICLLWLLISIVATILPALLGLTYSIDISNTYVKKNWGLITIADLSLIGHQNTDGPVTINTQQAAAQAYGIEGENYVIIDDTDPSDQIYYNAIYTDDMVDFFIVRFFDYNPENSLLSAESSRYLTTNATCESYNIITDANTNGTTLTYIDGDGSQANEYIEEYVPGLTTYILDTLHPCGERCASLLVYQAANNDTVDVSSFYKCNNSVSAVYGAPSWNASVYALPDVQAQIWAGAIGSTGFEVNGDQRQYQVYSGNTQFSTLGPLDYYSAQIAISGFTAYGLAAYNQNGVRQNVTGYTPNTALQLDVEWKWALTVLAIIPFLHFLAYVAVIAWANKAIIKDDSHLSTAKLLQPIVERLGNGGCILTGDDIVKRDEFKDSRVAYGFTDMGGEGENKVMHLGVIFEHPQEGYRPVIERAWPDGRYNGPDDEKFRKRSRRMSL